MKKNEVYEGIVTGYGSDGEGVIKQDGFVVFVPFVIRGERIKYKVLKVDKTVVYAKVEEIIEPSEFRRNVDCKAFGKCGGCRLLHMSYEEQLRYKHDLISDCFTRIAFCSATVEPTFPSVPELRYRNKLQLPLRKVCGKNILGFFVPDSHRIVETDDCLIQGEWCGAAIRAIKEYAEECNLSFYDESADNGLIRHLIVKNVGNYYLVCVVVNGDNLPSYEVFLDKLKTYFGTENITLTLNRNVGRSNVILGEKTKTLYGCGYVYGEQFGVKYRVGTHDFIQINDGVKERLYTDAVNSATQNNPSLIVDAYCGGGLMTALLAKKADKVIGVEIVPEAIANAKSLVAENNISNAKFICGACEELLPDIVKQAGGDSVVVLDPPRKGVDKRLIAPLLQSEIKKIVYISCNPATLARDVGLLTGALIYDGNKLVKSSAELSAKKEVNYYSVEKVKGYDMFADCKGVETLCILTRR